MELQDFVILAVSTLGFISVFKSSINFLKWVWVMLLRPSKNLKDYGAWAVITGSTDGIGKALAFDLASKGLNLVLVGRNPSKLEATSSEVHEKYGGQVGIKKIVIDLAKHSGEEIAHLMEEGIRGLDVGILVNNAGMAFPYARFFHEVDLELLDSIRKVNIEAATWITKSVLHIMLKKRKGAIVNIGSGSTMAGSSYPLYSVYAASKAYVVLSSFLPVFVSHFFPKKFYNTNPLHDLDHELCNRYLSMFSRCIALEYKQHGIDVQCQVLFRIPFICYYF